MSILSLYFFHNYGKPVKPTFIIYYCKYLLEVSPMCDLTSNNCGCGGNNNSCLWIILILLFCGNGFGCNDGCGCGGSDNSCLWIILILLFCGNGFGGCGNGCGNTTSNWGGCATTRDNCGCC